MQIQRKARALFIGAALLGVLVGAAGCKDKDAPTLNTDTTTTTAATGVAEPATDPASPVGMAGRAAKAPGPAAAAGAASDAPINREPGSMPGLSANGAPALPGQITPPAGNSFESSGGSSGLGTKPKPEVPGQHVFDVKPTAKR